MKTLTPKKFQFTASHVSKLKIIFLLREGEDEARYTENPTSAAAATYYSRVISQIFLHLYYAKNTINHQNVDA